MLDEEKHILIERFFNNELSDAERARFEQLLGEDMEFREEVKLQRSIIGGINLHGKELLRKELTGIYSEVKPEISKQNYKPHNSDNLWSRILKWGLFTGVIGGIAFAVVRYHDKIPLKNFTTPEEQKQDTIPAKKESRKSHTTVHRDTVWHIIHVHGGKKGDTVNAYSEQEVKEKMQQMNSGAK